MTYEEQRLSAIEDAIKLIAWHFAESDVSFKLSVNGLLDKRIETMERSASDVPERHEAIEKLKMTRALLNPGPH